MTVKVAWFSTDFSTEKIPDPIKSARNGRQEFVEGQQRISFGGTYLQRGAMPAMELTKHGYESVICWRFQQDDDGNIHVLDMHGQWHDDIDIFWSQRWMAREGPEQMRRARAAGILTVSDLDDGFWHLPKSNVAHQTTDAASNSEFNRDHYKKVLAACDLITVSTDALASDMRRLGPPVEICKNAIQLERWPIHDPGADGMIGWVGGIAWRASDLAVLKPVLPGFLRDYGLPIFHGGDSDVPGVPKFWTQTGIDPTETKCVVSKLCHVADYPNLWQPINLALVPLENHPFNVRKSHLKGLEASACGIPFIYSSKMPEYTSFGAGIQADNARPKTWRFALESMVDPDARREEGARNRAIAEQWDITDKWVQWDAALRSIMPQRLIDKLDQTDVVCEIGA
jgi:hypothetical protein